MTEIRCSAVLFDMDGTLVDSTACVEIIWTNWALKNGIEVQRTLAAAHGRRTVETLREVAPFLDIEAEAHRLESSDSENSDGVKPIPGALSILEGLDRNRWAIVTSASRDLANRRIAAAGLPPAPLLIAAEDVTNGKPDPDGYLKAAAFLGIAPSLCVVLEDTPAGIQAARSAGMRVLALTTTYSASELLGAETVTDLTQVRFILD